jgi:hypothetical protein
MAETKLDFIILTLAFITGQNEEENNPELKYSKNVK